MNNLRTRLTAQVGEAFRQCGLDADLGTVAQSGRPDLCQFQCNGALAAAKRYRRNPMELAESVAAALRSLDPTLSVSAAAPGFVNISVADSTLADAVDSMRRDSRLRLPVTDNPKTIVLDYGGPNTAKHLHVGHLRPAIIGDTMYRIARFYGHRVIGDAHIGDWGLPIGMVIATLLERNLQVSDVPTDEFNDIYPEASLRSKSDPEFRKEAQRITRELHSGNERYLAIWREITAVSVADAKRNYAALNLLPFDFWYGESNAQPYIAPMLERLRERGLLELDGGAGIVHVRREEDTEPMPPLIVTTSDGGEVYATTDLATILQREQDFRPDEIWYFTDARQTLYFKQLFRAAELAGLTGARCHHTGFGTVNGKDGKPYKTRSGEVMRLFDMIDDVREKLPDPRIACAAIRIADMQNAPAKDYQFDMDKFTAREGKTGPYLLYACVRIAGVLAKSPERDSDAPILPPASEKERTLMLAIESSGDFLERAFRDKAP
ncbi:MAG: arginine--tRNA ligase, partial [Oscillospiraceae bacterium]|nr:arginine--tRNA ligase [Oscillospiraceae bacterium]